MAFSVFFSSYVPIVADIFFAQFSLFIPMEIIEVACQPQSMI